MPFPGMKSIFPGDAAVLFVTPTAIVLSAPFNVPSGFTVNEILVGALDTNPTILLMSRVTLIVPELKLPFPATFGKVICPGSSVERT